MYALETNGPSIAEEMRVAADKATGLLTRKGARRYVVVALAYNRADNYASAQSTLKQAYRALAHVIAYKPAAKGKFAACIVTPDRRVMNYTEARAIIHG